MDIKNYLISICSTINIFLPSSYTIDNTVKYKINLNGGQYSKIQFDEIIFSDYKDLSKKYISYIKELWCPPKYIADMLRDLADSIKTSYPGVKKIIIIYNF